jgi:hypothetical protein
MNKEKVLKFIGSMMDKKYKAINNLSSHSLNELSSSDYMNYYSKTIEVNLLQELKNNIQQGKFD